MNKYFAHLDLPFTADLSTLLSMNLAANRLDHIHCDVAAVPGEVQELLQTLGIVVSHAEMFNTPPRTRLAIHVDGDHLSNITKLNWCFGAEGSVMNWFKLLPNYEPPLMKTGIGTSYLLPDAKKCTLVASTKIGRPTLVNAGVPHSIINPTGERRVVISLVLDRNSAHVQWEDALKLFAPYLRQPRASAPLQR